MSNQTFQKDKLRKGVADGINEIFGRIQRGESTTAIVLPPRYGKSNLMRAFAIEAIETNFAGAVVCLVPWIFLGDQLNDPKIVEKMEVQHGMAYALKPASNINFDVLTGGKIHARFYSDKPQRHWFVMTMGQAKQDATKRILTGAASYFKNIGKPLVVFIDESHQTAETPEGWGGLANELVSAGAHLVLVTGTPERSDNIGLFGFRTEEVDRQESDRWIPGSVKDGQRSYEHRVGEKARYRVVPDVFVSLNQAWIEEIIAKIDSRRFIYNLNDRSVEDMSESDARLALAKGLKDPEVVRVAARSLLDELRNRRSDPNGRDTAAIVFVGSDEKLTNDDQSDRSDYYCKQAKRIIEEEWHKYFTYDPDIKIATMGEDNGERARKIIKRFAGSDSESGVGDIIIVKQMGGVGLDAPRLKVALDLSTVRTKASTTQRWLRVATLWDGTSYGTLILPNDPVTSNLYNEIITDAGGGQCQYENESIIDTKFVEVREWEDTDQEENQISDARRAGSVAMDGRTVDVEEDIELDNFLELARKKGNTSWILTLTRRQQADIMAITLLMKESEPKITLMKESEPKITLFDANQQIDARMGKINEMCKSLTNLHANYGDDQKKWIDSYKKLMKFMKNHARIHGDLKQCRDIDKLNVAIEYLQQVKNGTLQISTNARTFVASL